MKIILNAFLVLILLFLVSCSSPTNNNTEDSLSISIINNQLKITNNGTETIYLFLVEQVTAALINWAPGFSNPKVAKNESLLIKYSEIQKGEEELKSGDKVIVYYWDGTNKANPNIFSKVIEL